ncbi:hypothetical protein BJX68DRAFT_58131 [Aspergillus pseudodeflectus]|uniref:Uncharacterized protein n=1 Tax=Aspergillus pseudodeflectus TaxID=176178 RepID=A0ABR4KKF2_9EURO
MLRSLNISIHGSKTREGSRGAKFQREGTVEPWSPHSIFSVYYLYKGGRARIPLTSPRKTTGSIYHDEGAAERASIKSQESSSGRSWCQLIPSSGGWTLHRQADSTEPDDRSTALSGYWISGCMISPTSSMRNHVSIGEPSLSPLFQCFHQISIQAELFPGLAQIQELQPLNAIDQFG